MTTYSPKLDILSENIIYLLSLDSRLSITTLADILKINRKIVENRYNSLFNKGHIRPLLIYNHKDMLKATILIKLIKFDDVVLDAITQLHTFVKVKETLGNYDLSLLAILENKNDIQIILNKINKILHGSILNLDVIYHDIEDTPGYKSFCHSFALLKRNTLLNYNEKYVLDIDAKKILFILKSTPHAPYSLLIKKTGFTYKKIKKIMDELIDNQIIRFSVDPDYQKLGLEFHNLLIKINLAKREKFETSIINHPNIHWVKRGTGSWDYILSVTSKSIQEFIETTRKIRTENKDIILNFNSLISNIHVMRQI